MRESPVSAAGALALTLSIFMVIFGLTGCGSKSATTTSTSPSSSPAAEKTAAQLEIGNTLNYGAVGTTTDLDCADGKSLDVLGSNNTLTVKGTCKSVHVAGNDNKITVDRIDENVMTVGLNNTVTYKDGDPKVEDHGSGNTISKG